MQFLPPLSNIQEWIRPTKDVYLMSRIVWNPKLGQFISRDLSILSPPNEMIIIKIQRITRETAVQNK